MIKNLDKNKERARRHMRVRKNLAGTAERPRLVVYRSLSNIYVQVIDDSKGVTLVSASTLEKALAAKLKDKTKQEQAYIIGETIAKRAIDKKINQVVFDRGGYIYTGRVKNVSDGARAAGLQF
ncbi:MAG: 50S ribosomal protein L18 [Clostridia bacterium]|jgi:large subunit ribosomal protein L18|nr:50S ribosomal protein L18 [Clostridia bacterium]